MTHEQPDRQPVETEVVSNDYQQESTAMQESTEHSQEEIHEAGIKVASNIFSFFQ